MRKIGFVVLSAGGLAVLIALGTWQLYRFDWKNAILADISARIAAEPVALPSVPDPRRDRYLPVRVAGRTTGDELHVLVSTRQIGAAYRLVVPFETGEGRRIMVDLGVVPADQKAPMRPARALVVDGNLHWPDEIDRFTPEPDRAGNIWFARDVPVMAEALGTEELLVVARATDPELPDVTALPVSITGIPNNHLGYAITWFSLAAIWAGMTALLWWRMAGPGR